MAVYHEGSVHYMGISLRRAQVQVSVTVELLEFDAPSGLLFYLSVVRIPA